MSLKKLKRMSKLKRISEFTPETLISEFGLYESAIINLRPEEVLDDEEPRYEVNTDVRFLQLFCCRGIHCYCLAQIAKGK